EQHYAVRFALALYRAESEFLTGDLLAAEERLMSLRERAVGRSDHVGVACLRGALYTTLDRTDRAIDVALEQLRAFGIEWSAHPPAEEVHEEYKRLRERLGERPIEALVERPTTSDADLLAVMEILQAMLPAAVFTDKNLHDLTVIRMANLSVQH